MTASDTATQESPTDLDPERAPLVDRLERPWILKVGILASLIALWELVVRISPSVLYPGPVDTVIAGWDAAASGDLWRAFLVSNQSFVLGFLLALVVGIPVGIAMGRLVWFDKAFGVYIDILLVVPMVALMPVVIVTLGIGLEARTIVVFLFCIVTLVANVRTGAKSVNPELVEMGKAFGARGLPMGKIILLPGMLPALAAGVRLSIARAFIGMIIIELSLVAVGFGEMLMFAKAGFDSAGVFAIVAVIILEAQVVLFLARRAEKRLAPGGFYGRSR